MERRGRFSARGFGEPARVSQHRKRVVHLVHAAHSGELHEQPVDFSRQNLPTHTDDTVANFDLTVGGTTMRLQHEMRVYPGCCGGEAFIGDEDYNGFVDLWYTSDAGDGGLDAAVD